MGNFYLGPICDVTTLLLAAVILWQKEIVFLVAEIDQLGIKRKDATSKKKNVVTKITFKIFL